MPNSTEVGNPEASENGNSANESPDIPTTTSPQVDATGDATTVQASANYYRS